MEELYYSNFTSNSWIRRRHWSIWFFFRWYSSCNFRLTIIRSWCLIWCCSLSYINKYLTSTINFCNKLLINIYVIFNSIFANNSNSDRIIDLSLVIIIHINKSIVIGNITWFLIFFLRNINQLPILYLIIILDYAVKNILMYLIKFIKRNWNISIIFIILRLSFNRCGLR